MGDGARSGAGGTVPFWAHQVAEMLVAALLVLEGARTGQHTAVFAGLGGALLLLSLMSDGPLGAWPWIGRRVHRVLDVVFVGMLALSPLVLSLDQMFPIVIIEAAAVGLLWLTLRTNWTRRDVRRAARSQNSPVPAAPPEAPAPSAAHQLGAALGRAKADGPRRLGQAVGRARTRYRRPPDPP